MWLESHIFPGIAALLAQDEGARVHAGYLKIVLLCCNLPRSQFSEFAAEGHKTPVAICISENAGLETVAFVIDECADLHPTACNKLKQVRSFDNVTHTKVYVGIFLGWKQPGGGHPLSNNEGGQSHIISLSCQCKIFQKKIFCPTPK